MIVEHRSLDGVDAAEAIGSDSGDIAGGRAEGGTGARGGAGAFDCRRNGGSECPCNWPTISRSFQLWPFFVEGLTEELEPGEL